MKTRKYSAIVMLIATVILMPANKAQAVVFGSDVHPEYNNSANPNLTNLSTLLTYVWDDCIGLVGDNVRRAIPSSEWDLLMDYVTLSGTICQATGSWNNGEGISMNLSKGNHDMNSSNQYGIPTYTLDYQSSYNNSYIELYAINSDYFNLSGAPGLLNTWLDTQKGNGKIKIIMSHFPLHTKRQGGDNPTAQAQTDIYDVIDWWTKQTNSQRVGGPLDVIFVWGHNHDALLQQQENIDKIATPGEKMAISYNSQYNHANANKTLNFTYLNAGFVNGTDGGHISQVIPMGPYYYQINRHGINGWETGALISRRNL